MSKAKSVAEYLGELPVERRAVVSAVRDVVLARLPKGYDEGMGFGMICYTVPRSRVAETYNGLPLCYASIAAQKNHYAVYLMGCYGDSAHTRRLQAAFDAAGKKLDMGKSCVRFKKLEDIPLPAIGDAIAAMSVEEFATLYEGVRKDLKRKASSKAATRKSAPAKKATASLRGRSRAGSARSSRNTSRSSGRRGAK